MTHQVAVVSLAADDGKTIFVVVRSDPAERHANPECYANKDQKHSGHIRAGHFVQAENGEPLTKHERELVEITVMALRYIMELSWAAEILGATK